MNLFIKLSPTIRPLFSGLRGPDSNSGVLRHFSSFSCVTNVPTREEVSGNTHTLLSSQVKSLQVNQCRNYKIKVNPKKRCAGCYFERRFGRLYVECTLKPRHKQAQKVLGMNYFRDDYSKGHWEKGAIWGFRDKKIFYQLNNQLVKYNWLAGRLGKDL